MNHPRRGINRRAFLYAAGTTGVALPFLEGLPERSAFAQSPAKPVFGFFLCTANGVVQQTNNEPERFWPTALGALTTANMRASQAERCTGILADYADRLLIIRGLKYPTNITGCGHAQGLVQCLTGRGPTGSGNQATSTGPSADTVIAGGLNPPGVAPLNLFAGEGTTSYIAEKLSFSGPGQVRAAERNPYNVYLRLAGLLDPDTGGPTPEAERIAKRRNSINDLIRDQINYLKTRPQLSAADKQRLDLHFTSIRDVENTIGDMGSSCTEAGLSMSALQAINTGNAFLRNGVIEEVAKLHIELVGLSFACNANRVATLQHGNGTDATRYTINGREVERFHWVSHRIKDDGGNPNAERIPEAMEWHAAIDRIRMNTFKHLLDKWSEIDTPNGPLLDNAFAMWTSHVSEGPSHSFFNLPIVIAGSAGGYLKQGQYVEARNVNNSRLLNTLITAMGLPNENFGQDPGLLDVARA